jgi:hypothetical protein
MLAEQASKGTRPKSLLQTVQDFRRHMEDWPLDSNEPMMPGPYRESALEKEERQCRMLVEEMARIQGETSRLAARDWLMFRLGVEMARSEMEEAASRIAYETSEADVLRALKQRGKLELFETMENSPG